MRRTRKGRIQRDSVLLAVILATVIVIVCAIAIARLSVNPAAAAPSADESPCVAHVEKTTLPRRILLGEEVTVTLHVRAACPEEVIPRHIVFVLDASANLDRNSNRQMKIAATGITRDLDLDQYPNTKVGVTEFDERGRTLSTLTNDERRAINAINRVDNEGGARIDVGIQEGFRQMRRGRGDAKDITEVVIVMSNGQSDVGDGQVLAAARQAKSAGMLVVAVCVGSDCNESLMRRVASSPRYYFRAENAGALRGLFQQIHQRKLNISVKKLVVRDTLLPHVQYIEGSAVPKQSEPTSPTNWLRWEDVYVPKDGVTYTYKVRPSITGHMPVTEEAWGELTDIKNRTKRFGFPIPWVTVLRPGALPTPDWTATPTRTPTVTPTPTASPTPRPRPLYLPCLFDESVW